MRVCRLFVFIFFLALVCASPQPVFVSFASSFPSGPSAVISSLLPGATALSPSATSLPPNALVLLFGGRDLALCASSMSVNASSGPEAIQIVALSPTAFCCDGNPSAMANNSGRVMAAFQLLQRLGVMFFHPMNPVLPSGGLTVSSALLSSAGTIERPFFPIRGAHYHSEHPLDLAEFFHLVDSVDKTWEEMFQQEFPLYLAWLSAHKVNRIEFVLLCPSDSLPSCQSQERGLMYQKVVAAAHDFGIALLADISFALKQQHAMRMIYSSDLPTQLKEIRNTADWALGMVGFDGISTEAGTSEFTATNCNISLAWYNELATYLNSSYPKARCYIKLHVSQGQVCKGFPSPIAPVGAPVNFNFLPVFGDTLMGVMPHTVQMYTLDDPTANTYGNANFSDILEIGLYAASQGRETIFYPENTYWINYDINTPLNLAPAYAWRAVADIRNVAQRQDPSKPFAGTFLFESGWEFGYWMSAIAHYEASWNPRLEFPDTFSALVDVLSFLDAGLGPGWAKAVATSAQLMRKPLIFGPDGTANNVEKLNGIAYIQGWDTWSELATAVGVANAQPDKVQFFQMQKFSFLGPQFPSISQVMTNTVSGMQAVLDLVADQYNATLSFNAGQPEMAIRREELLDVANITLQRAIQVQNLIEIAHDFKNKRNSSYWDAAETALQTARVLIDRRLQFVNFDRVCTWRPNPTAYNYTYLWSAKSMIFFWRDRQQLVNESIFAWTPCLMNVDDPIDVMMGRGVLDSIMKLLRTLIDQYGAAPFGQCLSSPTEEPVYPKDAHK